jgi:hypothetical protein
MGSYNTKITIHALNIGISELLATGHHTTAATHMLMQDVPGNMHAKYARTFPKNANSVSSVSIMQMPVPALPGQIESTATTMDGLFLPTLSRIVLAELSLLATANLPFPS